MERGEGADLYADVSITLPATGDCGDTGAICTEDGRMLSHRLELTDSGPAQQGATRKAPTY